MVRRFRRINAVLEVVTLNIRMTRDLHSSHEGGIQKGGGGEAWVGTQYMSAMLRMMWTTRTSLPDYNGVRELVAT